MSVSEAIITAGSLGLSGVGTESDIVDRIRGGFPPSALRAVEERLHLTHTQLAGLFRMPERSFLRRFNVDRLSSGESDLLYRIARVFQSAIDALGDEAKATRWLNAPNRALGGVPPLQLLDTEAGSRQVEDVIGRVLYGVFS